jgi:RHS repeat-associated protein
VQTGSVPTFGVTGELHDGAAGLVHLRARWYNARHGTFTAVDLFDGFAAQPYSQHPYQYAYANPVRWTDPSGQCVPEGDGPDACDANFIGTLRAYLSDSRSFERRARAERGYLAANVVFDAYPESARTYDPTTDLQLRRYIAARLWNTDVDVTLATLDFALQQWRLDDAHRMGQPVDVRPVVASAGILGVLTGGPEDFCYLSPGGGGGGGGITSRPSIRSRPAGGSRNTRSYNRSQGQGLYVLVERMPDDRIIVRYVGRGDAPSRLTNHANPKSSKQQFEAILVADNNLTKEEAHGLEHMLVNFYGGPKNAGGTQLVNDDWPLSPRHRNRSQIVQEAQPLFGEALGIIRDGIAALQRTGP